MALIINTAHASDIPSNSREKLALYNGMDVLSLFEIHDSIFPLLNPDQQAIYQFELALNHALLELEFRGCLVDNNKRLALAKAYETEFAKWSDFLHQLCAAAGYYTFYISDALDTFSDASGIPVSSLPRSWDEWKLLPLPTRKQIKAAGGRALEPYQKAIKAYNTPFNANSPTQKLQLFYHFFGHSGNAIAQDFLTPPRYNKTHGITEVRSRKTNNTWGPSSDREALEKIITKGEHSTPDSAYYWATPFAKVCLQLADISKTLGFLRCKLEDGYFRASFGTITETGRLNSTKNAQGYGSNFQNVAPKNRHIFVAHPGWKLGTMDLEQAESRTVGAICYRLFGATAYLDATESGDLHSLVCSMVWEDLPWPEEFTIAALAKYGRFPKDMLKAAKAIANQKFYRDFSYRDMSKRLGHGCLTADHEVLTPNGWVPISTKPPVILAWDFKTGAVSWEEPTAWVDKPWDGDLYAIEGAQYSMLATADHRMPIINRHSKEKSECSAAALADFQRYALPTVGTYVGGTAPVSKNQAALCAATQADGHVYPNGSVRFGFSRPWKVNRLKLLLGQTPYKETFYKRRNETYIHIRAEDVHWPTTKQAGPWLFDWPTDALQEWVQESRLWDATFYDSGTSSQSFNWLYAKDRTHLEWVYLFAKITGQGSSFCANDSHPCGRVGFNSRKQAQVSSLKIETFEGAGVRVYCPTVPSAGFICRRNNKVMFSQNSNYFGQPPHMAKQTHIPLPLVQHFQSAYFAAFPEIPQWHAWVIAQIQTVGHITTLLGRKRRFFGRPNDEATWREAIAYEPQSVATGDYTNQALLDSVNAQYRLAEEHGRPIYHMFLQKHDELGFEYLPEFEPIVLDTIRSCMERELTIYNPSGAPRQWFIPTEILTGWNLGYRTDSNPDGLAPPGLEREREALPNELLNLPL